MKRFFVDKIDDPPVLRGENHKHFAVVLRCKAGDEAVLCCGDGYDCVCRVERVERDCTRLSVLRIEPSAGEPTVDVTLFMAMLKGDKNDFVVQKATELGATEIVPVFTRFVQAHDRDIKTERMQRIAREAAQQCGRGRLPVVRNSVPFAQILPMLSAYDAVVFPYENATTPPLSEFLREIAPDPGKKIAVLIGSEGGFAPEEVAALTQMGVTPVTLGKRILRAETANIAVLSAVMYALGQWQ